MYDEPAPNVDAKPGSSSKSNLMTLSEDSFGLAVGRSFMLGGQSTLALRLLLAGVSERHSKSAGVATGEEVSLNAPYIPSTHPEIKISFLTHCCADFVPEFDRTRTCSFVQLGKQLKV